MLFLSVAVQWCKHLCSVVRGDYLSDDVSDHEAPLHQCVSSSSCLTWNASARPVDVTSLTAQGRGMRREEPLCSLYLTGVRGWGRRPGCVPYSWLHCRRPKTTLRYSGEIDSPCKRLTLFCQSFYYFFICRLPRFSARRANCGIGIHHCGMSIHIVEVLLHI